MLNKKKFAELLKKAIGERTTTIYADITGVNRTYISKLLNEKLDNPPSPEIIKRLSNAAYDGVNYEDFMIAAGYLSKTHTKTFEYPDHEDEVEYDENGKAVGVATYITDINKFTKKYKNKITDVIEEIPGETWDNILVEREVQAFQEKGIPIDRGTAKKIVEHRNRILQGKEKSISYIYEAKTLANALERLAELDFEFNFDDETMAKLVRKAREKYGMPEAKCSDPAAHGPNYPGSGVFDKNGDGEDEA